MAKVRFYPLHSFIESLKFAALLLLPSLVFLLIPGSPLLDLLHLSPILEIFADP